MSWYINIIRRFITLRERVTRHPRDTLRQPTCNPDNHELCAPRYNSGFSSCCSSLDWVREVYRLDNTVKKDDRVYHPQRRHAHGSNSAGLLTG
jgi:hypothetical protein